MHPDIVASAAVLVIERTIVRTLMTGSLKETQTARLLFQCLFHEVGSDVAIAAELWEHGPNIEP